MFKMELKDFQEKIKEFDKARGWENSWNIKDLLLNMNEEIGELWNIIKWVDDEKQKSLVNENKEEVANFIGDMMFILLKISNQLDVDAREELQKVIDELEKRMPSEKIKEIGHANKLAGGIDNKKEMDEKMLDVLQKVGKKMSDNNINWYLIGSAGLYLRNVHGFEKVNDIDFLVSLDDYENLKNLFEEDFVKEEENSLGKKIILNIDGIEVEICGESPDGLFMKHLDNEKNNYIELNEIKVNFIPLEKEESCYRELGRDKKADLIKSFIQEKK